MGNSGITKVSLSILLVSGCSVLFEPSEEGTPGIDTLDREACSTLAPLRDDFSGAELSSRWQLSSSEGYNIYSQGDPASPGANFVFDIPEDTVGIVGASLTSRYEQDMRGQALTVEVSKVPDHVTVAVSVYPEVGSWENDPPNARIEHTKGTGELHFFLEKEDRGFIVYDGDRDVFWQIREGVEDDEVRRMYFETGPSLDAMGTHHSLRLDKFDASHVLVNLSAGTGSSGEASFRSLNWNQDTTTYCLASDFKDDFEEPAVAPVWKLDSNEDCSFSPANGSLDIAMVAAQTSCLIRTTQALNLSNNQVELHFDPPLAMLDTGILSLRLRSTDNDYLQLNVASDGMSAVISLDGTATVPSGNKDAALPIAIMRIRHEQATDEIVWEVEYSDGDSYILHEEVVAIELDGLNIGILAHSGESAGTFRVGGVNAD